VRNDREIVTFAIDGRTGLLTTTSSVSGLSPDSTLVPGAPRGGPPTRNLDRDIWAADIHLTPDGKFLYLSERTGSTLNAFGVDGATGKLTYRSTHPTERQPRGFAIDPHGRYLVASGERSELISLYAIDPATGALALRNRYRPERGQLGRDRQFRLCDRGVIGMRDARGVCGTP
jgi:6-phosphogluconolactonase